MESASTVVGAIDARSARSHVPDCARVKSPPRTGVSIEVRGVTRGHVAMRHVARAHAGDVARTADAAGAARASRGGTPPRSTCQNKKKTRNERGRRRDRETYHRNGDTFTVANGVVAPVALPGCALAPLAEVMSARVTSSSGLSLLTSHASNSQNEGYRTRMTNAPPPNSHSRESRTRITHL